MWEMVQMDSAAPGTAQPARQRAGGQLHQGDGTISGIQRQTYRVLLLPERTPDLHPG